MRESTTTPFMLHLLDLAQRGEAEAKRQVCIFIWENYQYRIRKFYSKDTMLDRDDMRQIFWEGVLYGIEKDKGLGDRLYYLSQCAWWAVSSAVREAEKQGAVSRPSLMVRHYADGDEATDEPEDTRVDVAALVIERDYANGVVRVLAERVPAGNARRAFLAIMEGKVGDPTAPGANKLLADELGVSPQRASQIMKQLKSIALDAEDDADEREARLERDRIRRRLAA